MLWNILAFPQNIFLCRVSLCSSKSLIQTLSPVNFRLFAWCLVCALLSCSVVSDSATPWTVARQAPLSTGILQARILEWVAIPFFRGSSQPRMKYASLRSPALAGMFFTTNATWEAPSGSLDNHIWMIWSVWPPAICWLSIHIKIKAPYSLPCGSDTWRTVSSLINDLLGCLCCG